MEVCHLLFVGTNQEHSENLSWVFMWFEAISDLGINMKKSKLILLGKVANVEGLVSVVGHKIRDLSTTYLCLPLRAPHKSMGVRNMWTRDFRESLPCVRGNTSQREGDSP